MAEIRTLPKTWAPDVTVGSATLEASAIATAKIADDAVTNAKLADMTRGTIKVGGTANAPTDRDFKTSGQIPVGNGTDILSVAVSGDATLSAAGALTIGAAAVDHTKASTAVGSNTGDVSLPLVATTGTTQILWIAPYAGTLQGIRSAFIDALAASDSNYITFGLLNKGQSGAGSTQMLDQTGAAATTKVTGGTAIAAFTKRTLPTSATPGNLAVAAGDVLTFQAVVTGTLSGTVSGGSLSFLITPTT